MVCSKGTINSTPKAATVTVNQIASCQNLYWFDTTTKSCGQKQFCGMYMYQGLQTFSTQAQCSAALPTITVNNGISTKNPYKSSLSTSVQTKLNEFISTRIIVRSASLTPANYIKFLGGIITKLNTIKSNTPTINTTKLNTIGYLVYELQQIQDSIDDTDSFLDGLFN